MVVNPFPSTSGDDNVRRNWRLANAMHDKGASWRKIREEYAREVRKARGKGSAVG